MAGEPIPAPPTDEQDVKLKKKKNFTKPLDNKRILCYNKDVRREERWSSVRATTLSRGEPLYR